MLFSIQGRRLSRYTNKLSIFLIAIVVAIVMGSFKIGMVRSFSLVTGSFFVLFFPGWLLSFIAFPLSEGLSDKTEATSHCALDLIERSTLAVALSIIISSLVVFVLYNFPEGGKLIPKNFVVADTLVNMMLFATVAWRKRYIPFTSVLVLGIFPFLVVALNLVFSIAITVRNFISAVLILCVVLLVIRILTRRGFQTTAK